MPRELEPRRRLEVDLFGGPVLRLDGEVVALSPLQRCLLAAVYGAADEPAPASRRFRRGLVRPANTGTSRASLARLLWGDDSPESRHRLSQLLYAVSRKTPGGLLFRATVDRVSVEPEGCDADLWSFRGEVEEGDLTSAAAMLDAGFLSGLGDPPTRAFEDWLDGRRAGLRSSTLDAASRRWTRASEREDWKGAAQAARALLHLEPENEDALERMLLSLGMLGRVDEALAVHERFVSRRSRGEGRWQAGQAVRELVARLEALPDAPLPPPELSNREPDPEPELCGRDRELSLLNRAISGAGDRSLTTLIVSGEGGIGKTRLVEEALRGAHLRGFEILRAGTSEFERDIPLNPIIEAFRHPETGPTLSELGEPWNSVLLALIPELHEGPGPLPEVPYVDPGNLPRRTYEAVSRLITALSLKKPLILFLDDFQWADDTSVAVLEFLRRRWSGGRAVLILGVRRIGFAPRRRAEELVEEMRSPGEAAWIELEELEENAVERLIDSVSGGRLTARERHRISLLGGRNPFFTVELTHECMDGHLELEVAPGEPLPVPVSIRQLLERRLRELTSDAERLLNVLTVLGDEITLEQATELAELDPTPCAEGLDLLQQLRLVRWSAEGVSVRHQLVAHTVYSRLKTAARATLHASVGRWLERAGSGGAGEMAIHFDRAGLRDDALRYSMEAADGAEASGAIPEALRFLTAARRNTSDPGVAATILNRLGHLHYLHRSFSDAAPLLGVAADRLREQGRTPEALRSEVERLDALSRLESLPLADFLQKARELKVEVKEHEEWETLTKLVDVEIHTLDREGKIEAVRDALQEAEELCEKGPPAARCAARATLAVHFHYGSPKTALTAAREAVAIARKNNLRNELLLSCNRLAVILIHQARLNTDEGREILQMAEGLVKRSGDRQHRFIVPVNQGVWHLDIGELETAKCFFDTAEKVVREHPAPELEATLCANRGELALACDKVEDAQKAFEEIAAKSGIGIYLHEVALAGLGLCHLHEARISEAISLAEDLSEGADEWVYDRYLVILFRARLLWRRQKRDESISLLAEAARTIQRRFVPSWIKLKMEEARLRRRAGDPEATQVALAARRVAAERQLTQRVKEIERLLDLME